MELDRARSSVDYIRESLDLDLDKAELLGAPAGRNSAITVPKSRSGRAPRPLSLFLLLFLIVAGSTTYIVVLPKIYEAAPTGRELGDCGASIEEAKAKGCIFDNMSYAWVQPACHHEELLAEYRNRTEMPYYSDRSLKPEYRIPIEEIMRGDYIRAWAPEKHHPLHCAFMLSKIHLILINHLPIDSKTSEYAHTTHCGMVLMDGWLHEMPECSAEKGCGISGLQAQFTTCGYI